MAEEGGSPLGSLLSTTPNPNISNVMTCQVRNPSKITSIKIFIFCDEKLFVLFNCEDWLLCVIRKRLQQAAE